jgi:hypothetical protein
MTLADRLRALINEAVVLSREEDFNREVRLDLYRFAADASGHLEDMESES